MRGTTPEVLLSAPAGGGAPEPSSAAGGPVFSAHWKLSNGRPLRSLEAVRLESLLEKRLSSWWRGVWWISGSALWVKSVSGPRTLNTHRHPSMSTSLLRGRCLSSHTADPRPPQVLYSAVKVLAPCGAAHRRNAWELCTLLLLECSLLRSGWGMCTVCPRGV